MTKLKDMTDEELQKEYEAYYQTIYEIQCYGSRDLQWFYAVEGELHKRGISVTVEKFHFHKEEREE